MEIMACCNVGVIRAVLDSPEADARNGLFELAHGLSEHISPRTINSVPLAILDEVGYLHGEPLGVVRHPLWPWFRVLPPFYASNARVTTNILFLAIVY
jgi:hypothetical protein